MNKEQKFTPKYWVVHDKSLDDVVIFTAAKGRQESIDLFTQFYGEDTFYESSNLLCSLIEINLMET